MMDNKTSTEYDDLTAVQIPAHVYIQPQNNAPQKSILMKI